MSGISAASKFASAAGEAGFGASIALDPELNKAQKLMELIKLRILPMGALMGGMFIGVATAIRGVAKESGALEASMKRLEKIKIETRQFEQLYKNLERARQKVA